MDDADVAICRGWAQLELGRWAEAKPLLLAAALAEPAPAPHHQAELRARREAEAALQRERHKHITMQDEIAGLREQVTALQNTSRPPAPATPTSPATRATSNRWDLNCVCADV